MNEEKAAYYYVPEHTIGHRSSSVDSETRKVVGETLDDLSELHRNIVSPTKLQAVIADEAQRLANIWISSEDLKKDLADADPRQAS